MVASEFGVRKVMGGRRGHGLVLWRQRSKVLNRLYSYKG
jgi:hypothetical protein